jgi:hypothetical protein
MVFAFLLIDYDILAAIEAIVTTFGKNLAGKAGKLGSIGESLLILTWRSAIGLKAQS